MQRTAQTRQPPLTIAHLMSRPSEKGGGPIRFRVQADRRQGETLANGAVDRRARRPTTRSSDDGANATEDRAKPASSDVIPKK